MQKDGRLILPGRSVNKNMYFTPRACGTIQPDKDMLLPLHIDFVGSFYPKKLNALKVVYILRNRSNDLKQVQLRRKYFKTVCKNYFSKDIYYRKFTNNPRLTHNSYYHLRRKMKRAWYLCGYWCSTKHVEHVIEDMKGNVMKDMKDNGNHSDDVYDVAY